jgi:hypothetical protein
MYFGPNNAVTCLIVKDIIHPPNHLRRLGADSLTRRNRRSLGDHSRTRNNITAHGSVDVDQNPWIRRLIRARELHSWRRKRSATSDRQLVYQISVRNGSGRAKMM